MKNTAITNPKTFGDWGYLAIKVLKSENPRGFARNAAQTNYKSPKKARKT
jgi:hypothetical protein